MVSTNRWRTVDQLLRVFYSSEPLVGDDALDYGFWLLRCARVVDEDHLYALARKIQRKGVKACWEQIRMVVELTIDWYDKASRAGNRRWSDHRG